MCREGNIQGGARTVATISGGTGADTIIPAFVSAGVIGGLRVPMPTASPASRAMTASGADTVLAGTGNDTLEGDAFGNVMSGGAGNDALDGRAGADLLRGAGGAGKLAGGAAMPASMC